MKILQVLQFFSPKFGGTVNVIYNISKHLSKLGHDVTIITTDYGFDEEYAKSIEDMGVEVIKFKCIFNIASFLYSPSMKKWLKENLKEYDIIHMHNFRTYQQNIVFKYAKKYEIPYILQAHGAVLTFFQKQELKQIYDRFWGNKLLKNASDVIALTETELEQYKELGVPENKIKIIPNGVDISEYCNLPNKGEFRRKHNLDENDQIILYLGRLDSTKGIDTLLMVFKELIDQFNNFNLVIAGPDAGFLSNLEKLANELKIENNLLILGPLYNKSKLEAYIDADVFVTPKFSGFPITFLESCACNTPIITTKNGDKINWIDNNVGFVTNYNKNDLKRAIIKILSIPELKKELGSNGRKIIEEDLNWIKITPKIENLYKTVVKTK